MKRLLLIVMMMVSALLLFACGGKDAKKAEKEKKVYTIGITQYNDSEENVEIRKGIVQGLRDAGFKEGDNVVYKNQQAKNNTSYVTQINKKFVDDGCDMIVGIGSTCTIDALDVTKSTDTKVIYAAVSDTKSTALTDKDLNPIVDATGTIDKYNISSTLSMIKDIVPSVAKLGIMYTKNNVASKRMIDEYKYYGSKNNIDIVTIALNTEKDIELAYDTLIKKVDAIMIINDDTIESNPDYILKKSIEYYKPVFASSDRLVKKGAMAGLSIDLLEVGKEAGRMAGEVLSGKDVRSIKAKEIGDSRLCVNKHTLSLFGISVDIEALKDAYIYE